MFRNKRLRCNIRFMRRLDAIDRNILGELQADGRITNVELARRVGISAPPCLRRVRSLEEAGYIKGYRALLDEKALGCEVTAFAMVHLASQAEADLEAFEAFVHGEQAFIQSATGSVKIAKCNLHKAATSPLASMPPRVIHQDTSQLLGCDREEMSAIDALHGLRATQTQIGFVHQRSGLERVVPTFAPHFL